MLLGIFVLFLSSTILLTTLHLIRNKKTFYWINNTRFYFITCILFNCAIVLMILSYFLIIIKAN